MNKILSSFSIGKYRVLVLSSIPTKPYHFIRINGQDYAPVPSYDMKKNCVVVESNRDDFTGHTIEFI